MPGKALIQKILHIAFFAFLFAFTPIVVEDFYYRYVDETNYFQVFSVQSSAEEYQKCTVVEVDLERETPISFNAQRTVELVGITLEGKQRQYNLTELAGGISVEESERSIITIPLKLPCEMESGLYNFRVLVEYTIKGNPKSTEIISNTFRVL